MKREIEFASHPANLSLVRDFVRQFLRPLDITETEKDLIVLGLDEACTNVIRYAYQHRQDQLVALICDQSADCVIFRLRDYGTQCDPCATNQKRSDYFSYGAYWGLSGRWCHLLRSSGC